MDKNSVVLTAKHCNCAVGECVQGHKPPEKCICRLNGDVEMRWCDECLAYTWHEDEGCIRCRTSQDAI